MTKYICPFCKKPVIEHAGCWSHAIKKGIYMWTFHYNEIDDVINTARDILDDTVECIMAFEADEPLDTSPIKIEIISKGKV